MSTNLNKLRHVLLKLVPPDGTTIGNGRLRDAIGEKLGREIDEDAYEAARDALVEEGVLLKGQGRGGAVRLATRAAPSGDGEPDHRNEKSAETLVLQNPESKATRPKNPRVKDGRQPVAKGAAAVSDEAHVLSYRHKDRRKNNPEVGMVDPDNHSLLPSNARVFRLKSLEPSGPMESGQFDAFFAGRTYPPPKNGYGTGPEGLERLKIAARLQSDG